MKGNGKERKKEETKKREEREHIYIIRAKNKICIDQLLKIRLQIAKLVTF